MIFQASSQALMYYGITARAYRSLQLISGPEKAITLDNLRPMLEIWLVLALTILYESYFEFAVSWFPLYYLGKLFFLASLLFPQSVFPHVLYENLAMPVILALKEQFDMKLLPALEKLLITHAYWLYESVMHRSLELMTDEELCDLQKGLETRLASIEEEMVKREHISKVKTLMGDVE